MNLLGLPIIRSNPERKWDAKKGWVTTEKFKGEYGAICQFAAQQLGRFSSLQISPESDGSASLTLTLDAPDAATPPKDPTNTGEPEKDAETWELQGNDLTKDVWSHKRVKDLSNVDYTWLRQNVKVAKEHGTWTQIDAAIASLELKKIWRLFMDGVESYSVAQYVLKRSLTTSGSSLGSFVTRGANWQYTTQQIIAEFTVPNGLRFTLPQGAWIMRTPSVTFDGTKWANAVEWWHADEWNEVLYPKFNTPEATELPPITLPPSQQVKPPTITVQPVTQSITSGQPFTLSCTATGIAPIQYAWYQNGALKTVGQTYSVQSATTADIGSYVCKVTNAGGFVDSSQAGISVLP